MKLTIEDSKAEAKKPKSSKQVFALLPVFLLQFTYGMNSGFPAILTPQLRDECSEIVVGDDEESWIVSLDNIATTAFCISFGIMQHRLGPKKVLMLGCLPYCAGWLLTALASSVLYLYCARFLVGIGHAVVSTSVYTVEVTSTEMRASFSLIESVVRCAGCLVPYTLGAFLDWKTIAQGATLIPLVTLVVAVFVPESPTFLMHKGNIDSAKDSLRRLFGSDYNVEDHILKISNSLLKKKKFDVKGEKKSIKEKLAEKLSIFCRPEVVRPFGIIILLSVVQQFSGMTILRAYVVKIFNNIFAHTGNSTIDALSIINCTDASSVSVRTEAYYSATILGTVRLVASLALSRLLRSVPRRKMYFTSVTATALSLIGVATFSCVVANVDLEPSMSTTLKWCTLASSASLVFAVQLGVQTLPTLLSGELFPSEVRAFCKGVCRSFACILLVMCLKSFPYLESSITLYGTFYFMSAVMISSVPLIYLILPETKGVALEMIQHFFTKQKTIFYIDLEPSEIERGGYQMEKQISKK